MFQMPPVRSPFHTVFMSDGLEDISVLVARRLEETDVLVQLERGMAERNETPVDNVKFLLFNAPVSVEDLFNASRPAWSISSARGQEEQGSARKPSVSDWKNVAALYELNGGNEQGKLEMASSLSVESGDVFIVPEQRWRSSGTVPERAPFPCQIVPQDGGVLVRSDCDVVFTPPLTGCAFFTCRVGGKTMMFHVNKPYDFRSMIPVAVHVWASLSAAVRSEFGPKIGRLCQKGCLSATYGLVRMKKELEKLERMESESSRSGKVALLHGEFVERKKIMNLIPSTLSSCSEAWRLSSEECRPVVELAFMLSREEVLQALAAVSPHYGAAVSGDGRNRFQTLPVALRENGGFILYMCPQISHSYSEKEPFFIIRHGVPERSEFTPPDFETALRRLYDVETGNVPGFAPNAIQA